MLPTGGTVDGELDALLRGEPARLTLGCTIIDEIDRVVITEVPLGVTTTAVVDAVDERLRGYERWEGGVPRRIRRHEVGSSVHDVRDESSGRFGLRIVIDIERRTNVARVVEWLRTIHPVTVQVDCRLPAPMPELLARLAARRRHRPAGPGRRAAPPVLTAARQTRDHTGMWRRSSLEPTCTTSPSARRCRATSWSPTRVPLLDPRSTRS